MSGLSAIVLGNSLDDKKNEEGCRAMKGYPITYRIPLLLFVLLLGMSFPVRANAAVSGDIKKGNRFYQKGMYGAAAQAYEKGLEQQPNDAIINFNLGTAFYKKQEYDKALEYFYQALLSDDQTLRQKAHYNIGNTLFRLGEAQAETNLPEAVKLLETALEEYNKVLVADPQDEDAKINKAFVEKKVAEYKKALESRQDQENQQQDQQEQKSDPNKTCPLNNKQSQDQTSDADKKEQQSQQEQGKQDRSTEREESEQPKDKEGQGQESMKQDQQDQSSPEEGGNEEQDAKTEDQGGAKYDENAPEQLDKKEAMMLLDQYIRQHQKQMIFVPPDEYLKSREVEQDW
jgi:Ca-activated chloride channel family protein